MTALIVLVFLDAHDAATPLGAALLQAAEHALGAEATLVVRATAHDIPEPALIEEGRAAHAAAVARLSWEDPERLRGRLRLLSTGSDRRTEQTLSFEASDPPAERGRAFGLVLASLLVKQAAREDEPASPREDLRRGPDSPTGAAPPAAPPQTPPRWTVDAAVDAGVAIGGVGSGVGGAAGARRRLSRRLGLRVGVRARFGDVAEAQASALFAGATVGVTATIIEPSVERGRFGLTLRADALLLYETLSHFSSDDTDRVRRDRLLPGAALALEARWLLAPGAALFVGAGPEVAFGTAEVRVHQVKVAELVPLRVSIQGGILVSF